MAEERTHNTTMSSKAMSEASTASTRLLVSGWGAEDPGSTMTGLHVTVLGGQAVLRLALQQLLTPRDQHGFVDYWLATKDFLALPIRFQLWGDHILEDVLLGFPVKWSWCHMPLDGANSVLVALVLLHMRVKCVMPEELGGTMSPW